MQNIIKFFISVFLFFIIFDISGQDFHTSQYDASPMSLNPSLTGQYFGKKYLYRVNANYRTQWKNLVNKPFSTTIFGYDKPHGLFGLGGYLVNNRADAGNFNTLHFMLSGAYQIIRHPTSRQYLSVGLQMGFFYKSMNYSNYLFNTQYSAYVDNGLDPNLPNMESFKNNSIIRFDANMGIYYKLRDESLKFNPFGGFAIFHIPKPNESFTGYKNSLPMRFVLNGGVDINVNEKIKFSPNFLYMNQGKAVEVNTGILGFYRINNSENELICGFAYRNNDAVIIHTGMKYLNIIFRISYDVNTSYLNKFSRGRGGLEFSIIYSKEVVYRPAFF